MRTSLAIVGAVFAALAVAIYADGECSIKKGGCPDIGDECAGDFVTNATFVNGTLICTTPPCCAMPLICLSGKCIVDTEDEKCQNDNDCVASKFGTGLITCASSKKCVVQGHFNDSCTQNDHCYGDMTCCSDDDIKNKTCSLKGKCVSLPLGATCDNKKNDADVFQCGFQMFCNGTNCLAASALGEKCNATQQCDVYSICNDGKCIKRWSLKNEGDKCTDENACGKGLYCYKPEQKCVKGIPRQDIECTIDENCTQYSNTSVCNRCSAVDGKMYCSHPDNVEPDCVSELSAAYECYRKNGCAPVISDSLDTCAQLECTAETNAVFACQSRCEDYKPQIGKRCLSRRVMLRYCPLLPTWLRIVIAFSILIVIILVVFIIYAIYNCTRKKQNGYMPVGDEAEKTGN